MSSVHVWVEVNREVPSLRGGVIYTKGCLPKKHFDFEDINSHVKQPYPTLKAFSAYNVLNYIFMKNYL